MQKRRMLAGWLLLAVVATLSCTAGPAEGAVTRNGWGFGIADKSDPANLDEMFTTLAPQTFRTQAHYDTTDHPYEIATLQARIARAKALGVQQIIVTVMQKTNEWSAPFTRPEPAEWLGRVTRLVEMFKDDVAGWGVANEPNAGLGWLSGPHSDGPGKLAGYYVGLRNLLQSTGWGFVIGPEFHDSLSADGRLKHDGMHRGDERSTVVHYVAHYLKVLGDVYQLEPDAAFGSYAGWHPYSGVKHKTALSTTDFASLVPSTIPIWVTEVGALWNDNPFDHTDQATWLVDGVSGLASHSRVERIYYYQMYPDRVAGSTWDSGLLNGDGTARPAWYAWCRAVRAADGIQACELDARTSALAQDGGGLLIATRGPDNGVWLRQRTAAGAWLDWFGIGGQIAGNPAITSWRSGHLDIYARRASDGALIHRYLIDGTWSEWERIGEWHISSDPVPVSWGEGHMDVYARGLDGALIHTWFGDSRWHPFESLGGSIKGAPAVVSWGYGRVDVFARGTDDALYHRWFDGTGWNGWEHLGGSMAGEPAAISWQPGHNDVYFRGTDGGLHHRWYGGGTWNALERIGDWSILSDPVLLSWGAGHTDVYARGSDGSLVHTYFADSRWHPFESLGGWIQRSIGVASTSPGSTAEVFARGAGNGVYMKRFSASAWGQWEGLSPIGYSP